MTLPHRLSGIILAALIVAGGLISASSAKAEDLVDFLWGGSAEYGGGRSVVSFDPKYKPNQIIVSFSDRRLYLITKPGEAITYPVAVPTGEARWQGVTFVSNKRVNPPWTPTPEMVRNNPRLPRWVPGGHPMNPLGIRAMYLGSSAYRIHGTDAPWTIGQAVSHGCIRMTNQDVLDLYPRVPVGMRVTVTWQHFSTNTVASGDEYPRYGADCFERLRKTRATAVRTAQPTRHLERIQPATHRPIAASSSLFFWNGRRACPAGSGTGTTSPHLKPRPARSASKKKTASSATKKKSVFDREGKGIVFDVFARDIGAGSEEAAGIRCGRSRGQQGIAADGYRTRECRQPRRRRLRRKTVFRFKKADRASPIVRDGPFFEHAGGSRAARFRFWSRLFASACAKAACAPCQRCNGRQIRASIPPSPS